MAKILVIAGAGGVGSAVVSQLLARGDDVTVTVLNDREEAAAREQNPGIAAIHQLDLGDADAAGEALAAAYGEDSGLDAVVVCAAIGPLGPVETTPLSVVRKTLEINTVSHVAIFQALIPALRKTKGRIVYVSSMAGRTGMQFIGAYTASKYALEGFADVMRREVAPQGVSISLIEPGGIKTPMVDAQLREVAERIKNLSGKEDELYGYLYRGFQAMASASHEAGSSEPSDVADAVITALEAAKPETRYIVGEDAKGIIGAGQAGDHVLDDILFKAFGLTDPVA